MWLVYVLIGRVFDENSCWFLKNCCVTVSFLVDSTCIDVLTSQEGSLFFFSSGVNQRQHFQINIYLKGSQEMVCSVKVKMYAYLKKKKKSLSFLKRTLFETVWCWFYVNFWSFSDQMISVSKKLLEEILQWYYHPQIISFLWICPFVSLAICKHIC